jgi:hypothetical protein
MAASSSTVIIDAEFRLLFRRVAAGRPSRLLKKSLVFADEA